MNRWYVTVISLTFKTDLNEKRLKGLDTNTAFQVGSSEFCFCVFTDSSIE